MITSKIHSEPLPDPIETLERYFREGGKTLLQAVFENTFFVAPAAVRNQPTFLPDYARTSKKYYPRKTRGNTALWENRLVKISDNSPAKKAWEKYSGQKIKRGRGYGVRHIWGEPWNPIAFTAGWNLAYMPFWAGMLTEDQHPHLEVQKAIKQASWDLYFRDNPVCDIPDFVQNPRIDLAELLGNQPLLILQPTHLPEQSPRKPELIFKPSEDAIKQQLIRGGVVYVTLYKKDGSEEHKEWKGNNFIEKSNLRGNIWSGYLRNWEQKGIVKAVFSNTN
ncbi:MAG: hypothetical protein LBG69_07705 [Zoogloeaceae bacterium]|jgi:hypothetical protein|nr:hypothetical protein [Zoogloeaceae bacterium]